MRGNGRAVLVHDTEKQGWEEGIEGELHVTCPERYAGDGALDDEFEVDACEARDQGCGEHGEQAAGGRHGGGVEDVLSLGLAWQGG